MGSSITKGIRAAVKSTRKEELVTFVSVLPSNDRKRMAKALADLELEESLLAELPGAITNGTNGTDDLTQLKTNIKLLRAAAVGDIGLLDEALAQGADVNVTYQPDVMLEALGNDTEIAKLQLNKLSRCSDAMGITADNLFTIGDWVALPVDATPLILACRGDHIAVVRRLLSQATIDCNKTSHEEVVLMRKSQTALHWACRLGNLEVMRLLVGDKRVDVNAATILGYTPFALAVQQGHLKLVEELLANPRVSMGGKPEPLVLENMFNRIFDVSVFDKCDNMVAFWPLLHCAGGENRIAVVQTCMKDERIRKFFFDKVAQDCIPPSHQAVVFAMHLEQSPAMLSVWLENGLCPNSCDDNGHTPLDIATEKNMVEHMRVLLLRDAESTTLCPTQRAQLMGDAVKLQELVLGVDHSPKAAFRSKSGMENKDCLPLLHKAVLGGDSEDCLAELRALLEAQSPNDASKSLDGGKLPAIFYAVELEHYAMARELFERAHCFQSSLVDRLIQACERIKSTERGERSFRVCQELIDSGALEDTGSRPGAIAFLRPWCSSLIAVRFLEHGVRFKEFSQLCQSKNGVLYKKVDDQLSHSVLMQAADIAKDAPTGPIRQDMVVPHMKFFRLLAMRASFSADHEAAVAHAYALLGIGLERLFASDVQHIYEGSSAKVVTVAPKSFQRMQNKLLNPLEHGDPDIPRPRCAKNVDVLRGCIIVKSVQDLKAAYEKLQASFKVVRVKNTHNPTSEGYTGGYRSLLVNFVYEPGFTWSQLFGDKITFDFRIFENPCPTPERLEENETPQGNLWLDYVMREPSSLRSMGLQGLQGIASEQPQEPVRMLAELQLVLEPYYEGRAVSHMLFKIGRCDTGPMEMVRDFFAEYYNKTAEHNLHLQAVKDIAMAFRERREPPDRVIIAGKPQVPESDVKSTK